MLHCVDFRVFDGQMPALEDNAAKQQQEELIRIKMGKLNDLINKPFAIGFRVIEYSKLEVY